MDFTKFTKPARKLLKLKKCGAVIVAAGSAARMGGIDKVMAELGGEPMIARTVRAFQECDAVSEIVIVTREDLILPITNLTGNCGKVKAVVAGGKSRQESVGKGLNALSKEPTLFSMIFFPAIIWVNNFYTICLASILFSITEKISSTLTSLFKSV